MEIIPLLLQTIMASVCGVIFYQNYIENKRIDAVKKETLGYIESIKMAHNTQANALENLIRKVEDMETVLGMLRKGVR